MVVGTVRVELHLPASDSLKAKRSVVSSLKSRIRAKFNVSVAEVDHLDLWQRAAIGVAVVTNEHGFADEVLTKVVRLVESEPRIVLLDVKTEIV